MPRGPQQQRDGGRAVDSRLRARLGRGCSCGLPRTEEPSHGLRAQVMLFDLESDPTESTNLASSQPDLVRRLTALVQAINASAVDSRGVCAPHEPQQSPALHNGTCTPWLM